MLGHSDRVREVPFLQFEWLSVSQNAKKLSTFYSRTSIYLAKSVTVTRVKKIVRFTEDFVI